MRFVDPLITLWHMGGALPTHIGMAIYSFTVYAQVSSVLEPMEDRAFLNPDKRYSTCSELFPKVGLKDIDYMRYVHIASVVFIISRNIILEYVFPQMKFLKQFIKIAHIVIYFYGFLLIM